MLEWLAYFMLIVIFSMVVLYGLSAFLSKKDEEKQYLKEELYKQITLFAYPDGTKQAVVNYYQWFFGFNQSNKISKIHEICQQNEILYFNRAGGSNLDAYCIEGFNGYWRTQSLFLWEMRFAISPVLIKNKIEEQNITIIQYGNGMINLSISQNELNNINQIAKNHNLLSHDDKVFLEMLLNKLNNRNSIDATELSVFSKILGVIEKSEPTISATNNLIGIIGAIGKVLS